MKHEIVFAGFGGQGILLAGKLLCVAAMKEGKYVSHIPSYGAEMRGGTANCQVIISDEEVASPIVHAPDVVVALNSPSMVKFEPLMKEGGLLIYNSSLIEEKPKRGDIRAIGIEANRLAEDAGSIRAANMAAAGRLVRELSGLSSLESLIGALGDVVSARNRELNAINQRALSAGYEN